MDLVTYIKEQNDQIPQEFLDRFIDNYNKDDNLWMNTEQAYNGWFYKYYTEYRKFI